MATVGCWCKGLRMNSNRWWCASCMTYHAPGEPPCFANDVGMNAANALIQFGPDDGLRVVKSGTVEMAEVSDPSTFATHPPVAPFTPRDVPNLDEPDPVVIAYVEDILARAKTGELRAIAVACVYRARVMGSGWTSTEEVSRLKGEIAQLLHDFCVMHAAMRS